MCNAHLCGLHVISVPSVTAKVIKKYNNERNCESQVKISPKKTALQLFGNFFFLGSGSLESPGYPDAYPNNLDFFHSVPIPDGMVMNIYLDDFEVGYGYTPC